MTNEKMLALATDIINNSKYAMVGTISLKKFPNIRILNKIKNEGLKTFYFMTRADSRKIEQLKKNKRGCIYFYDEESYQTVMIEGEFKIVHNTTMPIAEIYKIDAHDPFNYRTLIFETIDIYFYKDYETTKLEI